MDNQITYDDFKKVEIKVGEIKEVEIKSHFVDILHREQKVELDFGKEGSLSFFNGRFKNKVK
jgi:hypothetical protein